MLHETTIDIMRGDIFVCTMHVPMRVDKTYSDLGKMTRDLERLKDYVESKRPSLKYTRYEIYLTT